jgi:hypothetical protein
VRGINVTNIEIYNKPHKFKYGWAAGFYDALSDDGRRYLDEIRRYGLRDCNDESFIAGYRAGRKARVGQDAVHSKPAIKHRTASA